MKPARRVPGRLRPSTPPPAGPPTADPPAIRPPRPPAPEQDPIEPDLPVADSRPETTDPGDTAPILYTPEQAAAMLQVRPSWLRRRAAARAVPCRFLGKHLRFARQDIEDIASASRQAPAGTVTRYGKPPRHA
ncbi:helix-turn-helix domain-containing protein [Actinosynnema sp. NPDC004786]